MRKEPSEDLAAVTRRRLEHLGRELAAAGLHPAGDDAGPPDPVVVQDPGRHLRGSSVRAGGWLEDRLPGPLRGRIRLGAAQVVLLVVLLAGAVVLAAWSTIRSAPEEVTVPVAHASPTSPALASPSVPTTSPAAQVVVVDVAGKVARPGVKRLPAGSRVIDALRQAGGARPGVDLSGLNLARVLVDGEQVLVGRGPGASAGTSTGSSSGSSTGSSGTVSLNTADLDQLDSLPGVGPVTAQKILDWRAEHGAFSSVEELLEVDGIGAKTLAELSPRVTL